MFKKLIIKCLKTNYKISQNLKNYKFTKIINFFKYCK